MTSSEVIKIIQQQTGLPQSKVKEALDNLQNIVAEELNAGREIQIPGFGNFVIVSYPERTILDPRDRTKTITAPAQNVAKFRPHPELTKAVRGLNTQLEGPGMTELLPTPSKEKPLPPTKPQPPQDQPKEEAKDLSSGDFYIPYVDLAKTTVSKKVLSLIPEHIARHYQLVPIDQKDNHIIVAMIDPEDREAIDFIKKKTGQELELRICTQSDLNHVLDQYSGMSGELKQIVDSVEEDEILKPKEEEEAKPKDEEIVENAPAAKIVQSIVKRAVREGASDIHIEPNEEEVFVRFRVDGVLRKVISLPVELLPAVVSRIKILSGLKIDETRLPQDGRFRAIIDGSEVDFRISTFPTVNGEKVVARILDKSGGILTLEQLGFRGKAFRIIDESIHKSHGMILVTGPTGSGKTTTLYAVLQKLMSVGVNIVTLEDPVEYRIPTINQGQIHASIGFTFADGLRAILRQDPDVIMIGEIRDYETADMAVHSALTGHIVLSTLHTNDAAGAVPRLIDMKIEPFLINSSLNAVVAQRLCRKICDNCKEPLELDEANMTEVKKEIDSLPSDEKKPEALKFFHGKGCDSCGGTGYKGRIGIFEVFELTNDLKELVAQRSSGSSLAEKAIKNGMVTMRQDGILKAADGITTLEEVWRVTKE